jgi:hypothetical protein
MAYALDTIRAEDFLPLVGTVFQLQNSGTMVPLTLQKVTSHARFQHPPTQARIPFSVEFQSPPGVPMPQRIYRLNHQTLGELDLFLVPIRRDATGSCGYEAVFN